MTTAPSWCPTTHLAVARLLRGRLSPIRTLRLEQATVCPASPSVTIGDYAALPGAGLADTLPNKADMDYVGYGVQEMFHEPGGGAPFWIGLRNRMFAPGEFVSGNFRHSAEFVKLSANPGGGSGGTCFGDSGGPTLLAGTATVVAVNSYVTNGNCAGVTYSSRVDIPEVLDWIYSFMY